jgi:electron transfer flavoprotein alpha subunit
MPFNILVHVLEHEGTPSKDSLAALAQAAELAAALGGQADALLLGGDELTDELCASLGAYGAARVLRSHGPLSLAQPVVDALDAAIDRYGYRYVILGGGLLGPEIGAGLGARRGAGVTVEVTAIAARDGELVAERPIFAETQICEARFRGELGIIVARAGAFEVAPASKPGAAEIVELDVPLRPYSTRPQVVRRDEQRGAELDIEGAEVLIAGGRGLGDPGSFRLCEELAAAFGDGAAVAATRPVVDAGWYPYAAQVGQTGKTVAPKLYLAAGISGAIQHRVGMQGSGTIVAVNKDASAPIFDCCDLGVIGDLKQILPKLTAAVAAAKGA